jgi:hypothetical protein
MPYRLYIMVMYLKFYGFNFFQISAENPNVLAFYFTKNVSL